MLVVPLHTAVEKQIQTSAGEVVLESYGGFPKEESNLYMIGSDGKLKWRAEKPDPRTLYSRVKLNDDYTLSTFTISGHLCELDLNTGKIISSSSLS